MVIETPHVLPRGLSNLKNLIGHESIVAECSGLTLTVYVTKSRLLVGKRFTLGENYISVPHSNVSTLELITRSIIPPLTLAMAAAIGALIVWWFPGEKQASLAAFPINFVLAGLGLTFVAGLVALWWRRKIGVLRIGIAGAHERVTVRLVSTSKAESVFRALKG